MKGGGRREEGVVHCALEIQHRVMPLHMRRQRAVFKGRAV